MRKFLRAALLDYGSKQGRLTSHFLACLTIISVASIVLETVDQLSAYQTAFLCVEWFTVFFFTLEYIGRLHITKPKRSYVFSFFGIIDLISILPTFFGLGNFTFIKSARAVRIIRLLRMVRLAKVARQPIATDENMSILSINILIYFFALLLSLLAAGTAMYLVEPNNAAFSSIPAGMWWSLKVFLMNSIPVAEPTTSLGDVFYVATNFVGLMLVGLLVGVVGNIFRILVLGKNNHN